MAFFKKWKNISKHKKMTEEWALATSNLRDIAGSDDEMVDDESDTDMFSVKFLGSTNIESARSEEATAEAVKAIISTAKATNRKIQRVNLCLSPKGIEMLEPVSLEPIQQISIYRISYCSADAVHGNVFAFICTEDVELDQPSETLVCYAFLCQKRKIAHKVTLTVARCFESAFQLWQEATTRKQMIVERRHKEHLKQMQKNHQNSEMEEMLIDFSPEICSTTVDRHRQFLQNTWVSFDDEPQTQQHQQQQHSCTMTSTRIHHDNSMMANNLINCS